MTERGARSGRGRAVPGSAAAAAVALATGFLSSAALASETRLFGELGGEWIRASGHGAFAVVEPGLVHEGEGLVVELAVPLLLRLSGTAGKAGVLRREDWDETSDLGQLVKRVELALGERTFTLRVGSLAWERLGHGTIVNDYGNAIDPDRHPAGLSARLALGAASAQVLAGDLLSLRLVSGIVSVEPLALLGFAGDRLHLAATVAADPRAPRLGDSPRAVVAGAGADVTLRLEAVKVAPYVDANVRGAGFGLHAGLLADLAIFGLDVAVKAEWRRVRHPYHPEYFDVAYEIERAFALDAVGEDGSSAPVPKASVDPGVFNSWRAELRARAGPFAVAVSAAPRNGGALDSSIVASWESERLSLALFAAGRGFGGPGPRAVYVLAEGRVRLAGFLYAWLTGGRVWELISPSAVPMTRLGAGLGAAVELGHRPPSPTPPATDTPGRAAEGAL